MRTRERYNTQRHQDLRLPEAQRVFVMVEVLKKSKRTSSQEVRMDKRKKTNKLEIRQG